MGFYKKKVLVVVDWENLRKSLDGKAGKMLNVNYNYSDEVYELIQSFIKEDEEILRILFYHALLREKYRPPISESEKDQLLEELESKGIFNKKYILRVRKRNFVSSLIKGNKTKEIIYPKKIQWDKIKPRKKDKSAEDNKGYSIYKLSSYHFIERLSSFNNVTCRLGYLSIESSLDVYHKKLVDKNRIEIEEKLLEEQDKEVLKVLNPRQKLVDVLMGIDIVSYSIKRLVDEILIFCNDTDILPAIKEAKRNGIKVIMAVFQENAPNKRLIEHIDEIRSK